MPIRSIWKLEAVIVICQDSSKMSCSPIIEESLGFALSVRDGATPTETFSPWAENRFRIVTSLTT